MPKKLKILHLIKSLGRGGAEKLIPETAKVHNQANYEFFCLYFYHQENNIVEELEASGIQVELIPSGNLGLFFQVRKVREFIQEKEIDIVHAHLPWAGILSRLVGKEIDIPIVYTEHNTWDRYNSISYWGNRFTFKKQDVAIAVSNEVALSMQLNSIFDPYQRGGRLKVRVIQNGVNTDIFRRIFFGGQGFVSRDQGLGKRDQGLGNREDRTLKNYPVDKFSEGPECGEELEYSDQGKGKRDLGKGKSESDCRASLAMTKQSQKGYNFLSYGRLLERKGFQDAIQAFSMVLQKYPNCTLTIFGEGTFRHNLEDLIHTLAIKDSVSLPGKVINPADLLLNYDCFIFPSWYEGFSGALVEAMMVGIPIIASDISMNLEAVSDRETALVYPVGQVEALIEKMIWAISCKEKVKVLGEKARQKAKKDFDIEVISKDYEKVLYSVFERIEK
ncbi:glycosyltransferase [Algoriphagus sediminis]|uniref:Glycosyltransferase n=1 Tax=Algoriphagus sediminis TaxID=3057113 RepID=A0ABT7YER8_9BACT|nr:glycosyltransferase [Algoriphagus sediminis]MDN3204689.1 glycosyltransferase [Algoriphagus sediminis]